MDKASTHLGTPELHKRKSVMIEGGRVPRSRVMDQHIFDRYLMEGRLDIVQHRAAEHLLSLAQRAGAWPTGANLSGTVVQGRQRNNVPAKAFALGNVLTKVERKYGWFHSYLVKEVVVHDWDVRGDEYRMRCLREALDFIADRCYGRNANPLHKMQRAATRVARKIV